MVFHNKSLWVAFIADLNLLACVFLYNKLQQNLTWTWSLIIISGFFVVLALFYVALKKLVTPQYKLLSRRVRLIILVLCSGFSLYFLTFSSWPVQDTQIFQRHLNIVAPAENGTNVELDGFQTETGDVSFTKLIMSGTWTRTDNNTLVSASPLASLDWYGYPTNTILRFKNAPVGGKVRVSWDDQTVSYNLASTENKDLIVHDTHPVTPPEKVITVLLTTSMMTLFFLILISFLVLFSHDLIPTSFEKPPIAIRKASINWMDTLWGAAGVGLFLWLTRESGLWVSPDSVNYLSAARHLIAWQGYIGLDTDLYTWWPPLLPGILALFHGGLSLQDVLAIRILYILTAGLTLGLYSSMMRKCIEDRGLYTMGMSLLLLSIPFWTVSITLMSEPFFLFFEALFFLIWIRIVHYPQLNYLLILILITSLLGLTRYVGVLFSASLGLLVFFWTGGSMAKRFGRSILAMGISLLPLCLWVSRNYLLKGVFTGKRPPTTIPVTENIKSMLIVITKWFLPFEDWRLGLFLLLFLAGGFLSLWVLKNSQKLEITRKIGWVLIITMFIYMAGLMAAFSTTGIADVNEPRPYSPLFFPMVLLFLMMIGPLINEKRTQNGFVFIRAAVGLVLLSLLIAPIQWLSHTVSTPTVNTDQVFSIYAYWDHPVIQEMQGLTKDINTFPLVSNCKKCLYFAGNSSAVEFYVAPLLKAKKPPFVIIWFKDLVDSGQFSTTEQGMKTWLDQVEGPGLNLITLSQSPQGAIYKAEAKK